MLLPCGISLFSGVEFVCCPKHFKGKSLLFTILLFPFLITYSVLYLPPYFRGPHFNKSPLIFVLPNKTTANFLQTRPPNLINQIAPTCNETGIHHLVHICAPFSFLSNSPWSAQSIKNFSKWWTDTILMLH